MGKIKYYDMDFLKNYLKDTKISFPFELMDKLKSITNNLYAPGKDELKKIWVKVKNPSYEEFKQDYLAEDEEASEEEIRDEFYKYEEPYTFYKIQFVKLQNGQRYLWIDTNPTISYIPNQTDDVWELHTEKANDIIKKLNKLIDEHINLIKTGKYKKEILDQLPYYHKTGTIKRSDFWRALKNTQGYTEFNSFKNKNEFIRYIQENHSEKPKGRLKTMTAKLFFKCCLAGYIENEYETPLSDLKKAYKNHADGRDNGLLDIDENDTTAFEKWHKEAHYGHPWEILRGGNSTHVSLYASHDEQGWYFTISGSSENRFMETINCFVAIKRMGYPVVITDAEKLVERLKGEEIIGIVPRNITPRYCDNLFPGQNIINFINLYEEEKAALPYITWQDIPVPEPQNCQKERN